MSYEFVVRAEKRENAKAVAWAELDEAFKGRPQSDVEVDLRHAKETVSYFVDTMPEDNSHDIFVVVKGGFGGSGIMVTVSRIAKGPSSQIQ